MTLAGGPTALARKMESGLLECHGWTLLPWANVDCAKSNRASQQAALSGSMRQHSILAQYRRRQSPKGWQPRQPHPGTRIIRYRCFLPDLAEFTNYRRGGTDGATIDMGCKSPARGLNRRAFDQLAERAGFEPAIRFTVYTLSRRAPSTTRTPLRTQNLDTSVSTRAGLLGSSRASHDRTQQA